MKSLYGLSIRKKSRYSQAFIFGLGLLAFLPVLLHAKIASADDITLTWKGSSGLVVGYKVFEREHCEGYDYDSPAWEGTDTTCTIYGLDETYPHYFVARAFNEFGESPDSNEVRLSSSSSVDNPDCSSFGQGGGGGCLIATTIGVQ
jgi:hypothetical protein